MYLHDILCKDGSLLNFEAICAKYGDAIKWLEYKQLISAIPIQWRKLLKNVEEIEIEIAHETLYEKLSNCTKPTKFVYSSLVDKCPKHMYKMFDKFCRMIDVQLEFETYQNAFINIKKFTNIAKYRDFQYRVLTNRVFTNDRLFYWQKADTQGCNICKQDIKQTPIHLLFYCDLTKKLWDQIKDFLFQVMLINPDEITISRQTIMTNLVHQSVKHIANTIVLITKQYIYRCKCENKAYDINILVTIIEKIYQMERYNAIRDSKIHIHDKKWELYNCTTLSKK